MRERVLIVEDDVAVGAVVAEVLRHGGYDVTFTRSLTTEVERIDSASAVILDIDTTIAESELAWLTLRQPCCDALPLVLMGVQVPEDLTQRLKSYSSRLPSKNLVWVQKPFRNEELLAAVRQAQKGCMSGQATGYKRYAILSGGRRR